MSTWQQVLNVQVQVQELKPQVQIRVQVLQNFTREYTSSTTSLFNSN